ncbi:MAG: hypothetical protein H6726_18620 [Sandaracinaceae bacterium]|nr:hypothetical protein [Sandaracinaceae bacterium]
MSVANVGQTAATARDLRKARQRRTVVRLALGVVLPTALALVYYGVIAAMQSVSPSGIALGGR